MEIGARLHHVQLLSADPDKCAEFYGRVYGMHVRAQGSGRICIGPERRLILAAGPANHLGFAAYAFPGQQALDDYRRRIEAQVRLEAARSPLFSTGGFGVADPDGNKIVFGVAEASSEASARSDAPELPARLQHLAFRSQDPARLVPFYRDVLGFVVSDRVYNEAGQARACFLRTDTEHHALAIFHAAESRHDHLSFETTDWLALRDWADRISTLGVPMVWGIGRHEEKTLNLWGGAIMRS